ncbi:lipoprotein-releasing system permease protein [Lampropedia hyalina DSM 16112]|jgi:lipoprotein-releasing system permease protein|uniref:Lipoprotein-releasing system permease protein n=1 Tax=Lampropedia hyalina DSM 16112 TaxID=1122156 RepID=A0A1M4XCX9_9BURK|nr:FtsX-like permease family protein [Lampropedia hyalina]SHE91156.1 lipoprotein-releasing system permease protein [Lampropedia hyalina DSM 16112]
MNSRLPFVWMVALRFLREGKTQTLLILAGITVGVAVVVFLSELIAQLQTSMIERVLGSQAHIVMRPLEEHNTRALATDAATIMEPRTQRLRAIDQWQSMLPLAQGIPGVLAASPTASGPAFAVRGRASKSVAVLGVEPARFLQIVQMDAYMLHGRFALSGNHTIIGKDLANDLGASVGDRIFVRTADGRNEMLQITGLFDIGNRDLNRRWVFTTLKLAQNLLDIAGGASSIDITVQDIFQAEAVARQLQARSGLTVESWMQTNAQLLTALRSQASSNTLIRSFMVIVVALGIASVLVVSVVQKQKEIGILRAMGASTGQMMGVFLLQGGLLGLAGALLGMAFAFGLLQTLHWLAPDSIFAEVQLSPATLLAALGMAVGIGLLAALLPARRAARLDPVAAIRG